MIFNGEIQIPDYELTIENLEKYLENISENYSE